MTGSFFRYSAVEVREKLGADKDVAGQLLAYYKRVNDHNKQAFADRVPEKAREGRGQLHRHRRLHELPRRGAQGLRRHRARAGLRARCSRISAEFNLDCVSCSRDRVRQAGRLRR